MKKPLRKPARIKLDLTKETVRPLADDQLTAVDGAGHTNHCPTLYLSCKPCHTC